jgi:hypothetical protein
MVILRGIVRSGTASTDDADSYIANAEIIQLSSVVYTSSNGTFYTSALTLDIATCQASEYGTVQYSIPDFATIYDPAGVISGAITQDANISISGVTIMTDNNKIFLSGSLTSRTLSMRSGVFDGCSGVITSNTENTFRVGNAYSMSGVVQIANGGFETGNFSGWSPEFTRTAWFVEAEPTQAITTAEVTVDSKRSGSYGVKLHTEGRFLDLAQSVVTQEIPSNFDTVDFWYRPTVCNGYGIAVAYFTVYYDSGTTRDAHGYFAGIPAGDFASGCIIISGAWVNVVIHKSDIGLWEGESWHSNTIMKIGVLNRYVS